MEEKQEKKKNIDVDKVKSVLNKLNAWMLYPERRMSDRTEILSLMQEGKLTDEERYIISSALKEMNIKGTLEKLENLSPEQVDKFEKQTLDDLKKDKLKQWSAQVADVQKRFFTTPNTQITAELERELMYKIARLNEAKMDLPIPPMKENNEKVVAAPRWKRSASGAENVEIKSSHKQSLWTKIKAKVQQKKIDFKYAIKKRLFGNSSPVPFDSIADLNKEGAHIYKFDFNRYPRAWTREVDYTKIDHVVFPNPNSHRHLDLTYSKLSGELNLGAYEKVTLAGADLKGVTKLDLKNCREVNLEKADLSNIKELDLSHCEKVNLNGLDLSKVKVKLPKNCELKLEGTKLPAMDDLDLSHPKTVLSETDLGLVKNAVFPNQFIGEHSCSKWPENIDASLCQSFQVSNQDMSNVKSIVPPQADNAKGNVKPSFVLNRCNLSQLESLDVSKCGNTDIYSNNMPNLKSLKICGAQPYTGYHESMYGNVAPNLTHVEVDRCWISPENLQKMKQQQQMGQKTNPLYLSKKSAFETR